MNAIATVYGGRLYRSRLEARHAAFFDLLGWKYEYEPFDLRGYIPDFILFGHDPRGILVEVKPVLKFPQFAADKIRESGWDGEALILGCVVPLPAAVNREAFGWMQESRGYWSEACLGRWRAGNGKIGFCHADGGFVDRISGGHDGGSFGSRGVSPREISDLWARSGNSVQWRAPR